MCTACLLLCLCIYPSHAQDRQLKEIRVRKKHPRDNTIPDKKLSAFAPGMQVLTIDSAVLRQYKMQQLSQLLSQQVPVFIRSYGMNSIATLNFRGSSSAQSQVYWNGIPLNNAALGMTDVSLLNMQLFDRVDIAYGGSSSLLGSGNVGAAVMLDNDALPKDSTARTILSAEAGSFAQYKVGIRQTYHRQGWHIDARLMLQSAQNKFGYTDLAGRDQKMPHAHLSGGSAILQVKKELSPYSRIGLSLWYQQYDRQIPAALFENYSAKEQRDASLRVLLNWHYQRPGKSEWYIKTAFFKDRMRYEDSLILLSSDNSTYQYYAEAGWIKQLNSHHRIMVFAPVNTSVMRPDGDSQTRYQYKTALAAAYHYQAFQSRLQVAASLRTEWINTQHVWLPGANASYRLLPILSLRANIQKSYRAPTLNEWYYNPGGNKDLKPEYGWSSDAGYILQIPVKTSFRFSHEATVFNRVIHDWILWFGNAIWTPHNIASVHSRGIETINKLDWQKGQWHLYVGLNTSFVLATTISSYIPGDGSIGKQIPYTPRYNGQANVGIGYRRLYISYNHTYTGYRFITTDESQYLRPYQTGNLLLSYNFRKPQLELTGQINNIWGQRYEVVNFRPMPGRNFLIGASLSL